MYIPGLNQHSMQLINNIVNGFKNYPAYSSYTIKSYLYDMQSKAQALEISRDNKIINLFLFYPAVNGSGKIGSIAIYGYDIAGHYKAIKSSMKAFGLNVDSVDIDRGGIEDFVDVYLTDY